MKNLWTSRIFYISAFVILFLTSYTAISMVWSGFISLVIALVFALLIAFTSKGHFFLHSLFKNYKSAPLLESPQQPVDENVQFTVYRPQRVKPDEWHTMLAFVHLSERPADAEAGTPAPVEMVARRAQEIIGAKISTTHSKLTADTRRAVPQRGSLTFVPVVPGVEFIPEEQPFLWRREQLFHGEEFQMRALPDTDKQTLRGSMKVFTGRILLAEIDLSINVDSASPPPGSTDAPDEAVSASQYRKIFPSYSHKDADIVEEFEDFAKAFGDDYLRDVRALRAGEIWDDRLKELIKEASVFQLFWSSNSMRSPFVRQEWEYALSLQRERDNFIRPIYWEEDLPKSEADGLPPEELARIHFHRYRMRARRTKTRAVVNIIISHLQTGITLVSALLVGLVLGHVIDFGQIFRSSVSSISQRATPTPTVTTSPNATPFPTATTTPTPPASPTPSPDASPTPTPTPLIIIPTPVPTVSPTPFPTANPTPFPTVVPTATPFATPTRTPKPTPRPTPEPTPIATPTPIVQAGVPVVRSSHSVEVKFFTSNDARISRRITLRNVGKGTAEKLVLTLYWPVDALKFISSQPSLKPFGVRRGMEGIRWELPSLKPGDAATLQVLYSAGPKSTPETNAKPQYFYSYQDSSGKTYKGP